MADASKSRFRICETRARIDYVCMLDKSATVASFVRQLIDSDATEGELERSKIRMRYVSFLSKNPFG